MNLALHPRLLSPAESPFELSHSTHPNLYPLTFDVLREAIARLPACRSLSELFDALHQRASFLLPSVRTCLLLRQPDACFELVYSSPATEKDSFRLLTDRLIDSGCFAQALKNGHNPVMDMPDQACLLQCLATPKRVYGMVVWVSDRIPVPLHQPLGTLVDLAALSLDRLQGGAETFLLPAHPDLVHSDATSSIDDIAIPADQLTGLAHRTHFIRFLQSGFFEHNSRTAVGVILLDIDGFHRVNSEFGCDTGDRVLRDVALRLDSALRSQYLYETIGIAECDLCFARTGADEFGLALSRMRHPHRLPELAAHLHRHLFEGFISQDGSRLYLSVSIGLASSNSATEPASAHALLRNANAALKRAKTRGRHQHAIYDSAWEDTGSPHLRTESILQDALRNDRFTLHFQPLFRLSDLALVGAEVLLRLRIDDGTALPPSHFIPIAESTGQIIEIGEWVWRRACRQMHAWDTRGLPRVPLAINVSAIELSRDDLTPRFARILNEEGVGADRFHVEITETAIARNEDQALANIKALRTAGFEVWIDDFGTGYSSLKSIKNFPISGLKLDREFVKDLARNPTTDVIASSILSMALRLGHPVVGEGIENSTQFEFLKQEGCAIGQGYLLGRPVDSEQFQACHLHRVRNDMHRF